MLGHRSYLEDLLNSEARTFRWNLTANVVRPNPQRSYKTNLHEFIEIIFQNIEKTLQSWHLDGYGNGQWLEYNRNSSSNFLFLISNIRIQIPSHRLKIVYSQAQEFHRQLDYPLRLIVPDSSYRRRMMQSILHSFRPTKEEVPRGRYSVRQFFKGMVDRLFYVKIHANEILDGKSRRWLDVVD
ncbi:hypothetical protein IEQ34_012357 [Dendrobium chrysotoxum]|uniref:Maturase K n=1 Tax=Dendrobium chrysotoxum TaxID=161865 RepID=A0AAV7GV69_DENCH|nr:hypothetical protein IEQ34_012357 [Dendrobium chrysotoxum]